MTTMQPGQIPTLTFPGTAQAGSANGQATVTVNGRAVAASSTQFTNILASLSVGNETALPAAVTPVPAVLGRASEQGLLHANIRSVLGGSPLDAGPDLAGTVSPAPETPFTQNGLEAILLPAGPAPVETDAPVSGEAGALTVGGMETVAGNAPAPGTPTPGTPALDTPSMGTSAMTGPAAPVPGAAPAVPAQAPAQAPALASVEPATATAPFQAAQSQALTAQPVPVPASPIQTSPLQTSAVQPAPVMEGGQAAAAMPASAPLPGTETASAPLPAGGAVVGDAPAGGMAATGDTAETVAVKTAKLPVQAALPAQVATADNAQAGMKASVLAKLPTQATPAQVNLPQATSPAPVEGQLPAAASPVAGQATAQSVAQTQSLNGAQTSATVASQLPAEGQSLKAAGGLKETNETRAILQPRGASALAAGQAGSTTQANAAAASASTSVKPDTTAAVSTTTTSGAEPALPAQREFPATAQPAALQPGLAQSASLETAPLLTGGEDADAAATAELDLQTGRMLDARVAADRNGAHLPRFAAHTTQNLAGQITRQFNQGNRVFDIRLDPAELGKVDVRLEMRADNRVHAVLTAERPDTLMELQRNARELERALNEAGLELSEEGLDFQMQEDGQSAAQNESGQSGPSIPVFTESETISLVGETAEADAPRSTYGFLLSRREGVDMRV